MNKQLSLLTCLLVLLGLLAACGGQAEPTPTAVPVAEVESETPTETAVPPTNTPAPTSTPRPTNTPMPTPTPQPTFVPTFAETACQFEAPRGRDVRCGYLTVPEDHNDVGNGRTIRLHVAIFPSDSARPAPDPILYLEGGPGGDALETIPFIFADRFAPFLANRDFIMFDQRGTGYSEPSLACPEYTELVFSTLEMLLDPEEEMALVLEALTTCRERLLAEGVNFAVYNSAQSAADVEALRLALDYPQWNLLGVSYGTRLAQTIMRDFPAGVRSVVLDSSYPISADLNVEVPANAARAFAALFNACAADIACATTYPDLETVFYDTVAQMNARPITVQVGNLLTGDRYKARLRGDDLLGVMFQSLYAAEIIPVLPQLIYEVADGRTTTLGALLSSFLINTEFVSVGMQYAVQCHEEHVFSAPGEAVAAAEAYPKLSPLFVPSARLDEQVCALWGAGVADARENEPIFSNIPTLILAGEFDPITPPAWGEQVADTLSNAYFFVYPSLGHGVSLSDACPREMALAFFADPDKAPAAACIASMSGPTFAGTTAVETGVNLVPVTIDLGFLKVESIAPEGWQDVGAGAFVRGRSALDPTTLLQQGTPRSIFSVEALLELLAGQLQLAAVPESTGTYEVGERVWTLYEATLQGFPMDLAMIEEGNYVYFVMLVSTETEREALITAVFQPILAVIAVP